MDINLINWRINVPCRRRARGVDRLAVIDKLLMSS